MMFDHIGLKVKDLDAAVRFYVAALESLGHVLGPSDNTYAGIGPKDAPGLWLYAAAKSDGSGTHIALRATDRAAVSAFHQAGLRAGGRDNGAPGLRKDYSPTLLRCFFARPGWKQRRSSVPEIALDRHYSEFVAKVSQSCSRPESTPRLNHRTRCSDEP